MPSLDRRIVRMELFVAGSNCFVAAMLSTVATPTTRWWLALPVALGIALLTAASDRYRAGRYLLYATAGLGMVGVVWAVAAADAVRGVIPVALLGLGVGFAANRLLFGVIRPVPAARRAREHRSD